MALPRQQHEDPRPTQVQPPVVATAPAPAKQGLSIQTLVIAAIASGAAAVIVSRLWDKGTIVASAMTPVIIAIVSEMLRKPAESELVKRPISMARSAVTSANPVTFTQTDRPASSDDPDGAAAADVRIYSSGSDKARTKPRRKLHFKVAIVTGLIAFLIAALFLTVPELIAGKSVTGGQRTTVFGGGGSSSNSSTSEEKDEKSNESGSSTEQDQTETTPQDSGSDQTDQTTPGDEGTTTTPPEQAAPQQTTPQQTTPAPTTPAPTTPAPTTPTTPTP